MQIIMQFNRKFSLALSININIKLFSLFCHSGCFTWPNLWQNRSAQVLKTIFKPNSLILMLSAKLNLRLNCTMICIKMNLYVFIQKNLFLKKNSENFPHSVFVERLVDCFKINCFVVVCSDVISYQTCAFC